MVELSWGSWRSSYGWQFRQRAAAERICWISVNLYMYILALFILSWVFLLKHASTNLQHMLPEFINSMHNTRAYFLYFNTFSYYASFSFKQELWVTYLNSPNGGLPSGLLAMPDSSWQSVGGWLTHIRSSFHQISLFPYCKKYVVFSGLWISSQFFYLRMSNKTPAGIVVITSKSFDLLFVLITPVISWTCVLTLMKKARSTAGHVK